MIHWNLFLSTALLAVTISYLAAEFSLRRTRPFLRGHRQMPPKLGGPVIFFTLSLSALFLFVLHPDIFHRPPRKLAGVLIAGSLVFLLGFLDDRKPLHYSVKLFGQILCACVIPLSGFHLDFITGIGGAPLLLPDFLGGAVIVGWLVLMMNAVNLIDGLDALAAGLVAIAGLTIFLLSCFDNHIIAAAALALSFALIGLLPFNAHPAKLYLGDSGSHLIGFLIGIFSLFFHVKTYIAIALIVPISILFVPILNTAMVIATRLWKGRNPLKGDIFHLHYRLLRQGLSHRATVFFLWGVAASLCVLIVGRHYFPYRPRTAFFFLGVLAFYTIAVQIFLGELKERRLKRKVVKR